MDKFIIIKEKDLRNLISEAVTNAVDGITRKISSSAAKTYYNNIIFKPLCKSIRHSDNYGGCGSDSDGGCGISSVSYSSGGGCGSDNGGCGGSSSRHNNYGGCGSDNGGC